jgi:hypothetical protein
MSESLLPLSHTRSFKLTIGDRQILRTASAVLGITEAEVLRIALRRWALLDDNNGLPPALIRQLRAECGSLAVGPNQAAHEVRDRQLAQQDAREEGLGTPVTVAGQLPRGNHASD